MALPLCLLTGVVVAASGGPRTRSGEEELAAPEDAAPPTACALCDGTLPVRGALPREHLLAAARALAARNLADLSRLDEAFRDGAFGPPHRSASRRRVHELARQTLRTWHDLMLPYVGEDGGARTVEAADVAALSARYTESVIVPPPHLRELRVGGGRVCACYDLRGEPEQEDWAVVGGRRLRYRLRDLEVEDRRRRVLSLDWRSSGEGASVEILLAEHYGFRLERRAVEDASGRYELFLGLDLTGSWVKRLGLHRPAGFGFWAARPGGDPPIPPDPPRAGSVLYVPNLTLRLLFLRIRVGDVRRLAVPMPLLPVEAVRDRKLPAWLEVAGENDLADWTSLGEVPPAVRKEFPDR